MGLISENLKECAVKVTAKIAGVPSVGSGVIYQTPSSYNYNYILTAKHILTEESTQEFDITKVNNLKIEYYSNKQFETLAYYKNQDLNLNNNLIIFENGDLIIIKINKKTGINFPSILVSDSLEDDEITFSSWSIFKANENTLSPFKYNRSDPSLRRIELTSKVTREFLEGSSGSGVFIYNKNILFGIISNYPHENFENATIECCDITFESINIKLKKLGFITLDDKESFLKREINGRIVEIYSAQINNSYLNLNLAQKRVKSDIFDDWFYDSLQYVDLLTPDYLFTQYNKYFYNNIYKASLAEKFYVPKNNFTLREAYIMPLIDRIIYMATVGELAEIIDDSLIPNIYASRFNKANGDSLLINGVEQWIKLKYKISEELKEKDNNDEYRYNCILHVDILNYFDNIDKSLLIEKLKRVAINDNQLNCISLLENFLSKYSEKSNGLPQNNEASALLATFYLNQVDTFMQNHTLAYYRFVDDIKILCKDKYEARKYLTMLEQELKRCQLSVNSQKTKIIEIKEDKYSGVKNEYSDENMRCSHHKIFSLELDQIKAFSKSYNYQNKNSAFHAAIDLLNKNIQIDGNENDDEARNLKFALSTIEHLGKSKIHLLTDKSTFYTTLRTAVIALRDKPWITHQVCKILSLLEINEFKINFLDILKEHVKNEKFNIYSYQQFQIWLLLAKQKVFEKDLVQFASQKIEINDKTQKATTAAMLLYLSTVDKNFKRILLRKMQEGFTDGYFQDRAVLIALRSFNLIDPPIGNIHQSLRDSFKFTNKLGTKDLVHYHDIEISDNNSDIIEQLFSI
ncbi:RNA-directed DNA polymerase [Elizabethkingia anophelis]|uniref:RNA-directed DNA polymerase n=1 Tax=Elizabethkingia anophelis TaxID=1117645 RepID=UPI001E0CC523|nr:RNA-directed DNA polymerase [Elizabethkingia anophelis]EHM7983047.1 RNA-directed DNA polymerase [Elizabethkingia anophelis]EHM8030269.1 RNA-directed DNA polymerase [Elizabethkingia anophelis]EHZ9533023.1 RNA-directed DNA polymerase [Elizabethkingia anophelis]EKU3670933.1 RNA-directed DNA polymerase [Elizabethkingia anophelis]EKW9476302.1 RNA-directed DNA polymerase [Elizabethkingia anophelis]